MPDTVSTTWEVDDIAVDGLLSERPPRQPLADWTAELYVRESERTLTAAERFRALRRFVRYADRGDYGRTTVGEPWYRERLPPDATIDALAIPIAPRRLDDKAIYEGVWAFVTGGSEPQRVSPPYRIDLETVILADRQAYPTRADLEAAYKSSGL